MKQKRSIFIDYGGEGENELKNADSMNQLMTKAVISEIELEKF